MISPETIILFTELANRFETPSFLDKDPSKFMHMVTDPVEQELVAFLSASLAFGRREQILKHIESILDKSGNTLSTWIKNKQYLSYFDKGESSFYRVYSHNAMISFFDTIYNIIEENGTLGACIKKESSKLSPISETPYLHNIICTLFSQKCTLIPHTKDSAAKKVNLFLRWMIRDSSPVDLGLWSSWYSKKNLLIPLDTHVLQEGCRYGLLKLTPSKKLPSGNLKTCLEITESARQIFPQDPARLDYTLFGLGVQDSNPSS